jgi:nitrite reductase/ring-hydroxylating ferredoxin subunit
MPEPEDRLERIIRRLQRGQRLRLNRADAQERDALRVAAQLAAAREPYPRMQAGFRRRLGRLLEAERGPVLTRRAALIGGGAAVAGLALGVGIERELGQAASHPGAFVEPQPGRWIDVAALVDLPDGSAMRVAAGAVHAYVFRRGQAVHAVSATCSHYPCALDWDDAQRNLLCPCHSKRFTDQGQPLDAYYPAPPLARVHARVINGRVELLGS